MKGTSLALSVCLLLGIGCSFENLADEREFLFGPTNVNAALGTGGLTAAVSRRGEVTVLRWPSPSYFDQLGYATPVLVPGARERPRMGAAENMGIFAGIAWSAGDRAGVTWLRDDPWVSSQRYRGETSNVLVTEYEHPGLGLHARTEIFVLPNRDVLTLHLELTRAPTSPVDEASFLFFGNLSPCLHKIPNLPVSDWLLDLRNDFAALYDAREDLVVHFRPACGAWELSKLDPLLEDPPPDLQGAVNDFIDVLDDEFGEGVYIALGADRPTTGRQVGFDAQTGCPDEHPWTYCAADAFDDAADGVLAGSPVAACQTNTALGWELDLSAGSDALTVYAAFSDHWGGERGARSILEAARRDEYEDQRERAEHWWDDWLSGAQLPDTEDPDILRVAKRALISIRTGADRRTGAIVASVTTQPPYSLDWPRDGAFINHALNLAGYHDMVTAHNLFYAQVQRKTPLLGPGASVIAPAGTYATNYYADGIEGGPIPFEIDNAGFAVWTMAEHRKFLDGPDRADYLDSVWPAIELGATELADCRDDATGLQCYANEGDSLALTRGLPGAVAVYTALDAAVGAGLEMSADAGLIDRWRARRDELKRAIIEHFWNASGYFETGFDYPRGFVSWVVWPARLLPYDDPRMDAHARHIFGFVEPHLKKETAYGLYDAEAVAALAHIWRGDAPGKEKIRWALEVLTRELATDGTDHYGEVYTLEPGETGKVFVNRTAVPHVWTASLVYLAAMEATRADNDTRCVSGCGCGAMALEDDPSGPDAIVNALVFLLPLLTILRCKKRNPCE